jgi:uncharacterized protein (AIM24 family)
MDRTSCVSYRPVTDTGFSTIDGDDGNCLIVRFNNGRGKIGKQPRKLRRFAGNAGAGLGLRATLQCLAASDGR